MLCRKGYEVDDRQQIDGASAARSGGLERRLVYRLMAYWRSKNGEDSFPTHAAIDPSEIAEIWSNIMVIDLDLDENQPVWIFAGEDHVKELGFDPCGKGLDAVPENSLAGQATNYWKNVRDRAVPYSIGGKFERFDGNIILYRSILLPLSDDGVRVNKMLGGANYRILLEDDQG